MNNITYAVSVDVNNPIIPYNVYVASVLDSNVRYLEITLYQNGNIIALSNEAAATASLVTDNVLVDDSVECTISDNIITVPLEDLQRHGNLDVQVTVTEGTKVLAIPFPIQVRVTPNIAENAQIDENSLGSYAEVVQEIADARGSYTDLKERLDYTNTAVEGKQDKLTAGENIAISEEGVISAAGSGSGTSGYNDLSNKPSINNVELNGNKTSTDLGLQPQLLSGSNIKTINNQSLLGAGNLDVDVAINNQYGYYHSQNLWDGSIYAVGKINYNTGVINTTASNPVKYALVALDENTDYCMLTAGEHYVLYPDNELTYNKSNYHSVSTTPVSFNSGSFKYVLFTTYNAPPDTPKDTSHNRVYWSLPMSYIIKSASPENVRDTKNVEYIKSSAVENHSFYHSVASKLQDLYNPLKPTSICFVGDSITAGLHSANGGYITNCWAKLFGDYLVERFNDKICRIPFMDENINTNFVASIKSTYYMYTNNNGSFAELRFYGSYIGIQAGQTSSNNIEVYIDGSLYDTFNFTDIGSLVWSTDNLTEDYHTIKIVTLGSVRLETFNVKKKVSYINKAVSGINSSAVRDQFGSEGILYGYDIVFCMIGTNDRSTGNPSAYDFNIRQIFKHGLEYCGSKVILMSATPSYRELIPSGQSNSDADYPYKMKDIANWVTLIGGKDNEETISFYNWLLDYAADHNLALSTFFNDGLHPTEATHALMFKHLLECCGLGINSTSI